MERYCPRCGRLRSASSHDPVCFPCRKRAAALAALRRSGERPVYADVPEGPESRLILAIISCAVEDCGLRKRGAHTAEAVLSAKWLRGRGAALRNYCAAVNLDVEAVVRAGEQRFAA